ncbi:glycosyltransferase family 2 protein [Candidatus Woesebacteria bacterium]|nr:MAG: glycosyltransferase family 2 protein [Candidatus Woesebacteria bacterium]
MFKTFIINHEKKVQRFLEVLPGLVSWNLILFPYWGIFIIPKVVAYYILGYTVYWFYQSFQIATTGIISHLRIQASMQNDWIKDLNARFKDWQKIKHVIIIPTYKEPLYILERTISSVANQTLPKKQIVLILAMEKKEDEKERNIKIAALTKKFEGVFDNFIATVHELVPGEIIGKSSNEKYAAKWFKANYIDKYKKDIKNYTVTSCDADHTFHKNHFASLTYLYLANKDRYMRFWQPAVLFYNNIWELPAITRTTNILGSIFNLSQLPRKDRLINVSNYSLSYKLLHEVDYWDADKIPEDWGIFFKSYFKKQGGVEVEANYLPVYADAAQSSTTWKTIKNQYEQKKRWAWGVSDDPWIIKAYFLTPNVPFWEKTMRVWYVIQSHFFWPVHWFAITIGLQIPVLLNARFGRTTLAHTVPEISSVILTAALGFLFIMLILDRIYRPERPSRYPVWRAIVQPLEFFLMPVVGFFFSALPGLDAHTRLMLGKYIEYKVTEKV